MGTINLLKRIDEVLYYIWDPLGVSREPAARDEYEQYAYELLTLMNESKTKVEIVKYLQDTASALGTEIITDREHAKIADILLEWKSYTKRMK